MPTKNSEAYSFFQPLVDALSGAICILNDRLEAVAFNKLFVEALKKNASIEIRLNETTYDKAYPHEVEHWKKILTDVLNGGSHEEVLRRENSQGVMFAKARLSQIKEPNGNKAVLIQMTDITEAHSKDLSLSAFRLLASNLPDTDLFLCDSKMNIILAGGGEMRKYGNESSRFEGKNMYNMADEFDLPFLKSLYDEGCKGNASVVEYKYENSYYRVQVYPLVVEGFVQNIIMVSSNISELKNANIKLQQISDAKDAILSVVAHDLRNPITAILGVVELVKDNISTFESKRFIIERAGHSALSIISDLLDISELGKEDFVLSTQPVELYSYLHELIISNGLLADSKNIRLEFEHDQGQLFTQINPDKFARVMNNLITNAIKFSHENSVVVVCAKQKANKIIIQVKDKGIGIPAHLQAHIFDRFTKAGRKGTAGENSIGLGMSIVKQIVLLHQGKILIDSEEGKGTTISIELEARGK